MRRFPNRNLTSMPFRPPRVIRSGMAVYVAVAAAIAVTLLLAFGVDRTVELPIRDFAVRLLPSRPAASTVVVAIDEQSLREIGAWPWSRTVLAEIVDRAADGGARAVILDTLLPEPRGGDEDLAKAMRRIPTVMVCVLKEHGEWLLPAASIRDVGTLGHGNFEHDHDGILRRLASTKQSRDRALTAVSLEAASMITSAPVPVGRSIAPAFRTPPAAVPLISAADLMRTPALAARLRGKLVFIGPTALGLGDRVLTPVSREHDPGVTVHAAAAESFIRGEEIYEIPPVVAGVGAGLVIASMLLQRGSRRKRLAAATSLAVLLIVGGLLLLASTGVAIPFALLLLSVLLSTATVEAMQMASDVRKSDIALEEIATRMAEHQAREVESKRVLAHELKTPLASMRGLTQLLGGYELNEAERRRVASLLESEAGKLQSMVQGLLELERLPLRDFDASSTVIDLSDLVRGRVEFLRNGTDRTLLMPAAPAVLVRADPALVERVVDNLVGNAVKYTPPPSPVTITIAEIAGNAVLDVEDRGSGIGDSERERIFGRFVRGSSAAGTEGLGLGLSLVAEVARWHGGTASVERGPQGGSRFRVVFPMPPATAKAEAM
jgi:signal transduction histidine kinase